MQKQLRIVTSRRLAVCPFSSSTFQVPAVPSFVFSRHLGRRSVCYRYSGVRVFPLQCSGWFVHCFPSGRRQLAALPF
jgi:pyridoxal/pyridoxine/pyridoxamine kinase